MELGELEEDTRRVRASIAAINVALTAHYTIPDEERRRSHLLSAITDPDLQLYIYLDKENLIREKNYQQDLRLALLKKKSAEATVTRADLDKLSFQVRQLVLAQRKSRDIWAGSYRSQTEQANFKNTLISYYDCAHPTNKGIIKCMILNDFFPRELVRASHIWKFSTRGEGLHDFGLLAAEVNSPRNGLLLCETLEAAFDTKRVCFLIDKIRPDHIYLKVLDPVLRDPATSPAILKATHSTKKFCDVDGELLVHPIDHIPFRRILDFHAMCAFENAYKCRWLEKTETNDNFFQMSLGASLPDMYHNDGVGEGVEEEEEEAVS